MEMKRKFKEGDIVQLNEDELWRSIWCLQAKRFLNIDFEVWMIYSYKGREFYCRIKDVKTSEIFLHVEETLLKKKENDMKQEFNVGDKVRINDGSKIFSKNLDWQRGMNDLVGNEDTITGYNSDTGNYLLNSGYYMSPLWLERVYKSSDFSIGEWVKIKIDYFKGQVGQIKNRPLTLEDVYVVDFNRIKSIAIRCDHFEKIAQPKFKVKDGDVAEVRGHNCGYNCAKSNMILSGKITTHLDEYGYLLKDSDTMFVNEKHIIGILPREVEPKPMTFDPNKEYAVRFLPTEPKLKVGDRVRCVKIIEGCPDENLIGKEGVITDFEGIRTIVKLDFDGGLKRVFIDGELEKVEKAITEWRPKKDEVIKVTENDDITWYNRTFKVYMDGKYWCEDVDTNTGDVSLTPWTFAKPINKPKITITSTPIHDNHIFKHLKKWMDINSAPKPKFNVGDIVKVKTNRGTTETIGRITKYFENFWSKVSESYIGEAYLIKFANVSYLYTIDKIEKLETFDFPTDKLSFRGKSKGIMLDENIVMYYSHKYKRILISEAEKKIPKDIVWVKVDRKDLKNGDVVCFADISTRYIFVDDHITFTGFYYMLSGGYNSVEKSNSTDGFQIYKAVEV